MFKRIRKLKWWDKNGVLKSIGTELEDWGTGRDEPAVSSASPAKHAG